MFDCIIVGAGPAGSTAAYHLAKRGRSVLLLEKDKLPRYKPCGGGVSPQIAQWFDFDFSLAISLKVTTVRYTWNLDEPVEVDLKKSEPIWMVRRDQFDHFLVKQAQIQGAKLQDGLKVTGIKFQSDRWQVNTAQGSYQGQYLIAADGARGRMASWLGFKQRKYFMGGALEVEPRTPIKDSHVAHFEFGILKQGYVWNFPKADGYSIGTGIFRSSKRKSQDLKQPLSNYAAQFNVDVETVKHHGHPLCLWDGNQKLHTQNALLAGEAACVVDPFTAEGIRPAIFSGLKASEAINQALVGDIQALEKYTQVMNQEWGTDMTWSRRLAQAFYSFPSIGYRVGVKNPLGTALMVKVLCGELRYSEVAHRALKRMSKGTSIFKPI